MSSGILFKQNEQEGFDQPKFNRSYLMYGIVAL